MARGINYYLPEDIVVKKVVRVDEKFDPRREAKSRIYKYSIFNSNFHSPLNRLYTHRVSGRLDREMMKEGAKLFLGTHDFSKFAGKVEKNKSTVRTIFRSTWDCENEALVYEVEGNAFLPHQVRRMVGALVDLGRERLILKDIQDGTFAKNFVEECDKNKPLMKKLREENSKHEIEEVGKGLRSMFSWLK